MASGDINNSMSGGQGAIADYAGKDSRTSDFLTGANKIFDPLGITNHSTVEGPDSGAYALGNYWQQYYGGMADPSGFMQMLRQQSTGQAPSAAEMQLQAGMRRAQASAQSMSASNPNISPEMAQRMAQYGMTSAQNQTNESAAVMRAQEIQRAQQLEAQMVQYFMSLGMSADQAQLQARVAQQERIQQTALANAGLTQQEKGAQAGLVGSFLGMVGAKK